MDENLMITVEKPNANKLEEIKQWAIWEKEPCSFDHDQVKSEAFYIVEGRAILTTTVSGTTEITTGDLVTVQLGQIVQWEVLEVVTKHFLFFE